MQVPLPASTWPKTGYKIVLKVINNATFLRPTHCRPGYFASSPKKVVTCLMHLRPELLEGTVMLQPVGPGSQVAPIRYREVLLHYRHGRIKEPLELRAWAFYERLLSRRTLLFSKRELRWECNTHEQCECRIREYQHDIHPYMNTPPSGLPEGTWGLERFYCHWLYEIVPR